MHEGGALRQARAFELHGIPIFPLVLHATLVLQREVLATFLIESHQITILLSTPPYNQKHQMLTLESTAHRKPGQGFVFVVC